MTTRLDEGIRSSATRDGLLLSREVADALAAEATRSMNALLESLMPRYSWDERLAHEIERRSMRARVRRLRWRVVEFGHRVATAVDVLRDRHDCGVW